MHDGRISDGLRYRPGAFYERRCARTREEDPFGLNEKVGRVQKTRPRHTKAGLLYVKLPNHHFGENGGFAFRWPSSSASIFAISSASSLTFCESQFSSWCSGFVDADSTTISRDSSHANVT